jgi:hypothetical protein
MINEFLGDNNRKKYNDEELINAIGPYQMVNRYWRKNSDFGDILIKSGMPLYNSNKEHVANVIKLNKKKDMCLVKMLKPVSLFLLFYAGIGLDSVVLEE